MCSAVCDWQLCHTHGSLQTVHQTCKLAVFTSKKTRRRHMYVHVRCILKAKSVPPFPWLLAAHQACLLMMRQTLWLPAAQDQNITEFLLCQLGLLPMLKIAMYNFQVLPNIEVLQSDILLPMACAKGVQHGCEHKIFLNTLSIPCHLQVMNFKTRAGTSEEMSLSFNPGHCSQKGLSNAFSSIGIHTAS